jgi:predicted AAA+ superfamily ATPase
MPQLKPWYQVVTPREDLRDNRPLDASEFAVHLDHIREKRAHADYVDPVRFFERTYLTRNLLNLASQVVRRLSGEKVEASAVFNMATQFGGGKTHSLTVLYHLAKGGSKAKAWKGVNRILTETKISEIPDAAVAVFVGTEFDVLDGNGGEGEPTRKTPWGEIAWQLGGKACFDVVKKHDEEGIAPAGETLRRMLPEGPLADIG